MLLLGGLIASGLRCQRSPGCMGPEVRVSASPRMLCPDGHGPPNSEDRSVAGVRKTHLSGSTVSAHKRDLGRSSIESHAIANQFFLPFVSGLNAVPLTPMECISWFA